MLILLGASYPVLSAGLRYQRRSDALMELEQAGLHALTVLTEELSEASVAGISLETDAVSFASYRDANSAVLYDPLGRPLWNSVVSFRIHNDGTARRLTRQIEEVGGNSLSPFLPSELTPPRNSSYFASLPDQGRVVAKRIDNMTLSASSPPKTVTLGLEFSVSANGHVYGLKLSGEVHPRN